MPIRALDGFFYFIFSHFLMHCRSGGMADAEDSKSSEGDFVWVQLPPPAPTWQSIVLFFLGAVSIPIKFCVGMFSVFEAACIGAAVKEYNV